MWADAAGRSAAFADGQIVERGGELIDQSHTHIRQLAQELGLRLDNLHRAEANDTDRCTTSTARRTPTQASDDLNGIYQKLHRDVSEASYPTLFDLYTCVSRFRADHMSIVDWIEESVPGGMSSNWASF